MKVILLIMFLSIASCSVSAQPRLPKNYYYQKLDNGLEVVVIENNKVPLATIEIAVKMVLLRKALNTAAYHIYLNICFSKPTETIRTRKSF